MQLSGDLVGLVDALGEKKAVVVGHDLGAGLAQCAGLFRPDLFTAIALLSVPFVPRAKESPSQWSSASIRARSSMRSDTASQGSTEYLTPTREP